MIGLEHTLSLSEKFFLKTGYQKPYSRRRELCGAESRTERALELTYEPVDNTDRHAGAFTFRDILMFIAVLGLNHKSSRLEFREILQRNIEGTDKAYASLLATSAFEELVILSTCNRIEIYFTAEHIESAVEALESFLLQAHTEGIREFRNSSYLFQGEDAIRHCFTVAPGLDSMILGEPEILGQMKRAFQTALEKGALHGLLLRLFEKAFQTAKEVRSETDIGKGAIGTASVSMSLAQKICGDLGTRSILILGAGKLGEKLIMHMVQNDCKHITVSSRRQKRAEEIAEQYSVQAVPYPDWKKYLAQTDILISATTHPEILLSEHELSLIMSRRKNRPLCTIDLAVPRTIDPEVSGIAHVHAFNIEDLKGIGYQNLKFRENAMAQAYAIIHAKTKTFLLGLRMPDMQTLAPKLAQLVHDCVRHEIQPALEKRLATEAERAILEEAILKLERNLAHNILLRVKTLRAEGENSGPDRLFSQLFEDGLGELDLPAHLKHYPDNFLEGINERFQQELLALPPAGH